MDWMKEIFKDATDEQMEVFKKKLGEQFVPNEVHRKKVDSLTGELDATSKKLTESQETITGLNTQLENFNPEEVEGYKQTIAELQGNLETFKEEGQQRENRLKKRYSLKDQFIEGGMNPDAVDLVVDKYDNDQLDKLTLGENGKIADFETNILNPTKEDRASLFSVKNTETKTPTPGAGGDDDNLESIKKAMGL